MNADLVLEGGGVKGIGLVGAVSVLAERGYRFPRVAGTSAGAIVGSLVAAGVSVERMRSLLDDIDYTRFRDPGLLDRVPLVGKPLSLVLESGIYEGRYLVEWLAARLRDLGVETFGDLRDGEGGYRLVVMAADVTQGRLVRLPWDYRRFYGLDPDRQRVADAVRASMSIPFYFEPVRLGRSVVVDGGVVSNFPIDTFDRTDGQRPRWPTFGIKLSARPEVNERTTAGAGPVGLALATVATMMNAHDRMHLDDPCVVARTMFVDTGTVSAVDFEIDRATQRLLYGNGRAAAERFLAEWDEEAYLRRCRAVR